METSKYPIQEAGRQAGVYLAGMIGSRDACISPVLYAVAGIFTQIVLWVGKARLKRLHFEQVRRYERRETSI
jgi:hypothetical protein